jgi:hypothetical protein
MKADKVRRHVRLYMIFNPHIIIQFGRSLTGKRPLPFYIQVAALAKSPTGYF